MLRCDRHDAVPSPGLRTQPMRRCAARDTAPGRSARRRRLRGGSATCACRSPTAATTAARTACRRRSEDRACSSSRAPRVLTFEEIEQIVSRVRAPRRPQDPADRRRADRAHRGSSISCGGSPRVPGIEQVVMTTNGHLLAELAAPLRAAGLSAINVSLDTLDADRFRAITSRGDLARVLAGIDAAVAAGLRVKTNAVALRGVNDDELVALCEDAWRARRGAAVHRAHADVRRRALRRRRRACRRRRFAARSRPRSARSVPRRPAARTRCRPRALLGARGDPAARSGSSRR